MKMEEKIQLSIKFTKFKKGTNWVEGIVDSGEYSFISKLYDEESTYGINDGRVSKLAISKGAKWTGFDNCVVNYDRGWDIEPTDTEVSSVFDRVVGFLEDAPVTRF